MVKPMNLHSERAEIVPGPNTISFVGIDRIPLTTFAILRPVREGWGDRLNGRSRIGIWTRTSDAQVYLGTAFVIRYRKQDIEDCRKQADFNIYNILNGFTGVTAQMWQQEMIEEEFGLFCALPGTQFDIIYLHSI